MRAERRRSPSAGHHRYRARIHDCDRIHRTDGIDHRPHRRPRARQGAREPNSTGCSRRTARRSGRCSTPAAPASRGLDVQPRARRHQVRPRRQAGRRPRTAFRSTSSRWRTSRAGIIAIRPARSTSSCRSTGSPEFDGHGAGWLVYEPGKRPLSDRQRRQGAGAVSAAAGRNRIHEGVSHGPEPAPARESAPTQSQRRHQEEAHAVTQHGRSPGEPAAGRHSARLQRRARPRRAQPARGPRRQGRLHRRPRHLHVRRPRRSA